MTISLTGVTVDTGVPAQNPRPLANPVISTAGNDAQAIARQQLPSAVPAPALVAAYSAGVTPQKPPAKPFSSAPSSSLAAQFIAQGASEDDLALFEPPPPPSTNAQAQPAANDYLNDLRVARGDVASAKAALTQASEQTDARAAAAIAKPAATAASETTARTAIASFANVVPNLFSQIFRRPTIGQVKGLSAYQLAEARNATMRKPQALEAEAAN